MKEIVPGLYRVKVPWWSLNNTKYLQEAIIKLLERGKTPTVVYSFTRLPAFSLTYLIVAK